MSTPFPLKTPDILSLCWLTVPGAHPLEHVDAALAGGFNAVGLRLVPPAPQDPLIPLVGNEPLIRELIHKLQGEGVSVLDVETVWIGPQFDAASLRPALEVAQRLGARNLLTMGNDTVAARLQDSFSVLCDEAAAFGVNVGMELAAYTCVPSIAAAVELVRRSGRPNAKLVVDSLHFARSGATAAEVAALDPAWIAYGQLGDARGPRPADNALLRAEARGNRFPPGEGDLPLRDFLAALPAGLPLGIETPVAAQASLPVVERGRLAGEAARKFFSSVA